MKIFKILGWKIGYNKLPRAREEGVTMFQFSKSFLFLFTILTYPAFSKDASVKTMNPLAEIHLVESSTMDVAPSNTPTPTSPPISTQTPLPTESPIPEEQVECSAACGDTDFFSLLPPEVAYRGDDFSGQSRLFSTSAKKPIKEALAECLKLIRFIPYDGTHFNCVQYSYFSKLCLQRHLGDENVRTVNLLCTGCDGYREDGGNVGHAVLSIYDVDKKECCIQEPNDPNTKVCESAANAKACPSDELRKKAVTSYCDGSWFKDPERKKGCKVSKTTIDSKDQVTCKPNDRQCLIDNGIILACAPPPPQPDPNSRCNCKCLAANSKTVYSKTGTGGFGGETNFDEALGQAANCAAVTGTCHGHDYYGNSLSGTLSGCTSP